MADPNPFDPAGDPQTAEAQESAVEDGELLRRKTTHEVQPGDMAAPGAE